MDEHTKAHSQEHHAKKRVSWKKVGIALGIIVILVAGFFLVKALTGKGNITGASSLEVAYTLKLEDGTILVQNSSSFNLGEIGSSFGFLSDKLDKAVENLKEGQNITITLSPAEAFGEYNESYVSSINRTQQVKREFELNRTMEVPVADFKNAMNEDPLLGKAYSIGEPWNMTATNITDDNVTLSRDVEKGQFVPVNEVVFVNVTKVTDDTITLRYGAEEQTINDSYGNNITFTLDSDYMYIKSTPIKGGQINMGFFPATVLDYNDTSIILDSNGPYAGKTIIVDLKLIKVEKTASTTGAAASPAPTGAKTDTPKVEAYVFAYCPYGLQFEKALLPVYDLLKDKADINIVFIGAMHGEFEKTESLRQLCIQKEYGKDKLFEYIGKFDADTSIGSCSGDDNCLSPLLSDLMSSISIDKSKIDSCMATDGESLYNQDMAKASKLGVSGSPTFIINGNQVQVARTPDAVEKAICSAFTTTPDECSQALSSTAVSAGFGSGSGSASSGGGCGA